MHKGSGKGQSEGCIQMAKRGEKIHKRKDGRWEGRYIKGRTTDEKPIWVICMDTPTGKLKTNWWSEKSCPDSISFPENQCAFQHLQNCGSRPSHKASKSPPMHIISIRCTNIFFLFWAVCRYRVWQILCWNVFFFKFYRPQTGVTSHLAHPRHRNVLGCCGESANTLHIYTSCRPSRYASNCHTHRNQNHNPWPGQNRILSGNFFYQNQPPVKSGCFCKWNLDCESGRSAACSGGILMKAQ